MACFPWDELRRAVGTEMKTLGTVEIFKVVRIDKEFVWIRPQGGSLKEISRGSLNKAWHLLKDGKEMELKDLKLIEEKRESYMAPILARFPNIDHDSDLVRIWWKGRDAAARHPEADALKVVGNVWRLRYHWPDCQFAPRPSDRNYIVFPSAAAAKDRGYTPCRVCDPGP